MAQKHKAPTQVTIVQEEKGALAQWLQTNWKMLAFAAVGMTAIILGSQIMAKKAVQGRDAELDTLLEAVISTDPVALGAASKTLAGTGLAGWADLYAVQLAILEERPDDASALLAQLEANASPLLMLDMPLAPEGAQVSVLEHLKLAVSSSQQQLSDIGLELANPDPAAGSPTVRFTTSAGPIEVVLYQAEAPKHVENFLANVAAGSYDGTHFHMVIKGLFIQGGDPNTKNLDDRTQWGQPGLDEVKVASEADNGLLHAPYVLSAYSAGADQDSSQFQFGITLAGAHGLDQVRTVFGKVVKGKDVLRAIARLEVVSPGSTQPVTAALLTKAEQL